jgi:histidinol-phosphate aminotransferase
LAHVPSHGNFILVRVGKGQEIFQQLLTQGVIVRPMGAYKFPEYVRVTVGTMEENRKFIDALERVIKNF